ncbi:hypothetical protein D9M69_277460 [compost metagenome]
MPLKIFEKVSPFLKLTRPSSAVREAALPLPFGAPPMTPLPNAGLKLLTKSGSAERSAQLAPTDSDESNCPSISPMLKLMA